MNAGQLSAWIAEHFTAIALVVALSITFWRSVEIIDNLPPSARNLSLPWVLHAGAAAGLIWSMIFPACRDWFEMALLLFVASVTAPVACRRVCT